MNVLKGKVEKLSRLFSDSPDSSSPSSRPGDDSSPTQARSSSKEGKSFSSFLSLVIPNTRFDLLQSKNNERDVEQYQSLPVDYDSETPEWRDATSDCFVEYSPSKSKAETDRSGDYKGCAPTSGNGKTLATNEDHDDNTSARSTSGSDLFEEATDLPSSDKPLQNLTEDSVFISLDIFEFLHSSLPNLVKGCQWVLLYSTLKHGISLRTLIRKSAELSGPCLLIVGDMEGAVFGGMLECPLKPTAKRKYQGTNQTFVFTTLYGEPRLFRPTGANRYYYICMNDSLAFGGGGNFALCLEGDLLSGTSGPCETFGNMCLAHKPEFELKNVELWGFMHSSQYTR